MTTVAQLTFDFLRARGLTTIFGNPGSNELPFLAAMPVDFSYVLGLHEGAVVSMADGFTQANRTYGALRWFAELLGTGETPGLEVPGLDFVRIAEGYVVEEHAFTGGAELAPALKAALAQAGPVLIEVTTADLDGEVAR